MHHHRHHGSGAVAPGCSSAAAFRAAAELIERLEAFQRDLEQQLADVADVLAHLRDARDAEPQLSDGGTWYRSGRYQATAGAWPWRLRQPARAPATNSAIAAVNAWRLSSHA